MNSPKGVFWERFALYLAGVLLAVGAWMWVQNHGRMNDLENKVQQLQVDKVSRQEFNALEDRIYKRMDTVKTDIIERIDWYLSDKKK